MKWLNRIAASIAVCGLSTIGMAQESNDIFKSLDKNEDGILVADEVPEAQRRFFDRLVRAGDENEDGKLSKAEYQATLKEDERPAGRPEGNRGDRPEGGRRQFNPDSLFDRFDSNKDGKLAKSELPEQAAERMGRLFDEAKKDELTKDEFREALGKMMRGGGRPGAGAGPGGREGRPGGRPGPGFFEQLDKNKDGKISKDEIPEQMRERMSGLFERLGTDSISLEQLAKMRQEREGSRPEGEGRGRRPEMRRDGDRPSDRPRDGEGRSSRDGQRPPMRDGDRERGDRPRGDRGPGERGGRPAFGGPGGPGGPAFLRVLDADKNGRISKEEALRVAKLFDELDRNDDGQLDMPELMGFAGRPGGGDRERMGRPGGDRPRGDRPEGDRPRGDRPEGNRPRGERPEGDRPEGRRGGGGPAAFMARFDENKDGVITKDEAPERMAENFDRIDSNGDGKLTADEFEKMFSGGRPGGERGQRDGDKPQRPKRPESE